MKKTASAFGVVILGLSSTLLTSPAHAATLADCGTAPAGGILTLSGDICQLTFVSAGTYNFTTPKSFKALAAMLVGAGGGAETSNAQWQKAGYAGSGGKVTYVDLSSSAGEESVAITVGAGGVSSSAAAPTDGEPSTLTIGSATSTAAGGGKGIWINAPTYCILPGNTSDYLGVGDGAGGNSPSRAGEDCVNAPGVNPSLGTADSSGNPAPAVFAGLNKEFGAGGVLVAQPANTPSVTPGHGAGVAVSATGNAEDPIADPAGGAGYAVIAWQLEEPKVQVEDPNATLADTGSGAYGSLLLGAGSLALASAMLTRKPRRRN